MIREIERRGMTQFSNEWATWFRVLRTLDTISIYFNRIKKKFDRATMNENYSRIFV